MIVSKIFFVYRQLKKYDGPVQSLCLKSRRPLTSPTKHSELELELISTMYAANDLYGMAEVYVRLLEFGYNRSSVSMCCANKEERLKVIK